MSNTQVKTLSVWDAAALHISRVWLAGQSPKAPGTVGSLVAMLAAPLLFMPLSMGARCFVLIILFIIGSIASTRAEELLRKKDPGEVVVDEVLGQWITYLPFAYLGWEWLFTGFICFRLFDILKPCPVRQAEFWLPAGWGIMIDDVVAGVYAVAALGLLRWIVI